MTYQSFWKKEMLKAQDEKFWTKTTEFLCALVIIAVILFMYAVLTNI